MSSASVSGALRPVFEYGQSRLYQADCLEWLAAQPHKSLHGVVTDPPYGLVEYSSEHQAKLRMGRGGVWRLPPAFDGARRSPLPRFTTLGPRDIRNLESFFSRWAEVLLPILVPGRMWSSLPTLW